MRPLPIVKAALYAALLPLATPAWADPSAARALAAETVPALRFADDPAPPPVTAFATIEGEPGDLGAYRGDVVVLNFWATWCAPCRHEMPSLQRLADATEGGGVAVVPMAFGRHDPAAMHAFWDEAGIETLPLHRDPQAEMARALGVVGLPHTAILDRAGRVVATLPGEADWASPEMRAVIAALAE